MDVLDVILNKMSSLMPSLCRLPKMQPSDGKVNLYFLSTTVYFAKISFILGEKDCKLLVQKGPDSRMMMYTM